MIKVFLPVAQMSAATPRKNVVVENERFAIPRGMDLSQMVRDWEQLYDDRYILCFLNVEFYAVSVQLKTSELIMRSDIFTKWDELTVNQRALASMVKDDRFPHTCKCGAPAYVGFSSVDCSEKCGVR